MATSLNFDIVIVGGSYAGLSAAMALGRSLRKVLIVDSGNPCNKQTPHSHNFITHDGSAPAEIARLAKEQVLAYPTVTFLESTVSNITGTDNNFTIKIDGLETLYSAKKVVFATGVKDIMPEIGGFSECWGISAIHCPYCHGYEYRNQPTGLLGNGDIAFGFVKMLANLTPEVTIFTQGAATFTDEQQPTLQKRNIKVVETDISRVVHQNGYIQQVVLADGESIPLAALYAKPRFVQHTFIPAQLGCEFTEHGYIKVDNMQRTNIPGVYACGDNTTPMRSVSAAVAAGTMAGAALNKEMVDEEF